MYSLKIQKHPRNFYEKTNNESGGNIDVTRKAEEIKYSKEVGQKW